MHRVIVGLPVRPVEHPAPQLGHRALLPQHLGSGTEYPAFCYSNSRKLGADVSHLW
jgi:hypothetical protein